MQTDACGRKRAQKNVVKVAVRGGVEGKRCAARRDFVAWTAAKPPALPFAAAGIVV